MSIDDLTHICLWSKKQINDCDRYKSAECPLEEHDKQVRADERANVIDLIDRHLWNYSKEVWADFQSVLEQLKEKNMENEFFNFDEVVEIEKKKSYNQAIDECITEINKQFKDGYCFGVTVYPHTICNMLEQLKEQNR